MGAWYWIGVLAGVGSALGVAASVRARLLSVPAALVVAIAVALVVQSWPEAISGVVGVACGYVGTAPVVGGAFRRGGTRVGLSLIIGAAAIALAAIAFIPALGYLEAVALPALGLRLRRRTPDTHAGLRSLTK
ncbi:MAG TPA: hypothetical protein VGH52_03730 [Gaiellaceae bacterium]|jgi:F0F1-type ATP synthase assembly protein I